MVLTDSCRGSNLVMRSISESYCEYIRNHACQEGRNFAPVHAIWECGYRCDPTAAREPPIIAAPYGNVGIVVTCPCSRTMFEGVLVFCCPRHISMRVSLWPVPIAELCLRVSLFCCCPRYMTIRVCLRSLLVADPLSGKLPLPRGMAVRQSQLRGIVDIYNILLAVPENCPEKRCSLPEGT